MKVSDREADSALIGVFDSDEAARAAIGRLRATGVAERTMGIARRAEPPPPDTPAMSRVFWTGFWWSIAGAVVGVAIGLAVGLAGVGVPGTPGAVWIQVASWGMFAHVAGAIIGCYLALDTGDRFSRNAAHHDQPVTLVRVQIEPGTDTSLVERALHDAGARTTERVAGPTAGGS